MMDGKAAESMERMDSDISVEAATTAAAIHSTETRVCTCAAGQSGKENGQDQFLHGNLRRSEESVGP